MTTIAVQHNVKDFDEWRAVFDEHQGTRAEYGAGDSAVFRKDGAGNELLILLDWSSVEDFQRFMTESNLQEVMERAGVVSEPTVTVLGEPLPLPGAPTAGN